MGGMLSSTACSRPGATWKTTPLAAESMDTDLTTIKAALAD
jgi:hypothetical protein